MLILKELKDVINLQYNFTSLIWTTQSKSFRVVFALSIVLQGFAFTYVYGHHGFLWASSFGTVLGLVMMGFSMSLFDAEALMSSMRLAHPEFEEDLEDVRNEHPEFFE